jgi:hypothetical protein
MDPAKCGANIRLVLVKDNSFADEQISYAFSRRAWLLGCLVVPVPGGNKAGHLAPYEQEGECYRKGIRTCYLPTLIRISRESTISQQYESQGLIPPIKRSCVSVGTRKGYSISNCDPFGRVYTMSEFCYHRKTRNGLIRRQTMVHGALWRCSFAHRSWP